MEYGDEGNTRGTAEGIPALALSEIPHEKLTSFAIGIALTGHIAILDEGEFDVLAEAEAAFTWYPFSFSNNGGGAVPSPAPLPNQSGRRLSPSCTCPLRGASRDGAVPSPSPSLAHQYTEIPLILTVAPRTLTGIAYA